MNPTPEIPGKKRLIKFLDLPFLLVILVINFIIGIPLITFFLFIIVIILLFLKFKNISSIFKEIGLSFPKERKIWTCVLKSIVIGLVVGIITILISIVVGKLFELIGIYVNPTPYKQNIGNFIDCFGYILIPAVLEEIIFRGYLLNRFADFFNHQRNYLSCFLSSFFFSIGHEYQGLRGMISSLCSGLIYGSSYQEFKNNLWVPIFAHIFYNTISRLCRNAQKNLNAHGGFTVQDFLMKIFSTAFGSPRTLVATQRLPDDRLLVFLRHILKMLSHLLEPTLA